MEAIIFCGIQASGKSSLYKKLFFQTHVRISMDLLRTRNRESRIMDVCFETQQPFVVDNTNPSTEERKKYIDKAKERKYKVIGYYFRSNLDDSITRNDSRTGKEKILLVGIRATYSKLEIPKYEEGFDELYYVELVDGEFIVKEWQNEI